MQAVTGRDIVGMYSEKTPRSALLAGRARALMPSGLAHDGRYTDPYPIYAVRAEGPRKWDVDGNEYVDYFGGHGSLILGHNHPAVTGALTAQLARGTHFGACHELEIEWADQVRRMVPSAERVRFTASGTEATLLAVRVARGVTGKSKLVRVRGHFHGWSDHMTTGYMTHFDGTPTVGVVAGVATEVVLVDADDLDGLRAAFERGDIAAVIVEPSGAHFGRIPLARDFLAELRRCCTDSGAILIFDEVVTGFRAAPGGYQSVVDICPDITTFAKILAGGLPGGALAGRSDILDIMDFSKFRALSEERISHQGTYNANPLSAAAGVAALAEVAGASNPCALASSAAAKLREGLNRLFSSEGIGWAAYGEFSGFHVFTNPAKRAIDPNNFDRSILKSDLLGPATNARLVARTRIGLLAHGVDLNTSLSGWVSATHGPAEIEKTVEAFASVVTLLRNAGALD